jgi:hypothetical protein
MDESIPTPTLEEFLACCDAECEFLVREYGFERLAVPREYNQYSVRFRKGELEVHVYGVNYGENASCDLVRGGEELGLGFLIPAAERKPKKRTRVTPGQLAQVRTIATRLKQHVPDFLSGDSSRFDSALTEWKRITRPRPVTEAHRLERERAQAVTATGHASKRADHAEVVRLLQPHAPALSRHQRRMLEMALDKLGGDRAVPDR